MSAMDAVDYREAHANVREQTECVDALTLMREMASRWTGDSGDTPIAVLLQGDEVSQETRCGSCGDGALDWPFGWGFASVRPAAMFQAELFCADCMPYAFDPDGAIVVSTLTGDPA